MQDCERPSLERQLLSNQLWETVAFIAKAAFMLGFTPWMIRVWGAQGYGEFALASSAFVLLSLVDLGIRARTRLALCADHDRNQWSSILWHSASTFAVIAAGTIAISLVLTACGLFGAVFKISPANRDLLFVTTAMSMLVMTSGLLLEPLIVAGRIGQTKCASAAGWLTSIPCVVVVLDWKGGAIAATTTWLGCLFAANLFVLWLNRRLLRAKLGSAYDVLSLHKFIGKLKEAFWINICNATWMTKTYGVTLLIAALNGPAAAGFFFILLRLSEIISALGAVSTDVLLTELAQNSGPEQRRHAFLSSYSWALTLCSHAGLLIAVFARDFFNLWLHPATPISIFAGLLITMLGLASAFNRTLTWAAIGLGLPKTAAKWGIAEAISFVAAVLLGSFIFGLLGQLGFALAATLALIPVARAVSVRLGASLGTIWLQPFRDVAPFAAINAAILFAASITPLPMAKFIAIPICTGVAFANLSRWLSKRERNSRQELSGRTISAAQSPC